MTTLRALARLLSLVGYTLACVAAHRISLRLLGKSDWPCRFLGGVARRAGFVLRVVGTPLDRDVFFVANHVSWADIFLLGGATGCTFVSRDDVGRWPVLRWLAAQNNTVMVSRDGRGEIAAQVGVVRAAMERHQPVALFPEGATGDGVTLLPFKPALFAVLLPPPRTIQVQPVVIDYGSEAPEIAWTGSEGGGANVWRILGRPGRTPVTLHFLDAFGPGEHPDRKALASEARARIARTLASVEGAALRGRG